MCKRFSQADAAPAFLSAASITHFFNPTAQRLGLRVRGGSNESPRPLVEDAAMARNPRSEKMEKFTAVVPSTTQGNLSQKLAAHGTASPRSDEQEEQMKKWRGLTTADLTDGVSLFLPLLRVVCPCPCLTALCRSDHGNAHSRRRRRPAHCQVRRASHQDRWQAPTRCLHARTFSALLSCFFFFSLTNAFPLKQEKNRQQFPGFRDDEIADKIHEYDGLQVNNLVHMCHRRDFVFF